MTPITTTRPGDKALPPLQAGDRLTRDEFERRYEAMEHIMKAELIEGEVFLPSPVRADQHGNLLADLIGWLGAYRALTPGVRVSANATVRLDLDNEPQPDALLFVEPGRGGQVVLSEEGYIEGAPELVAEVSASTVSIDLHRKLVVYRRNRVREYLVWRVLDQAIDWFVLHGSQYDRLAVDAAGIYHSEVCPGLWLDADALLRADLAAVLQVLQQGLASPEHATFVAKLQAAARP